MKANSTIAFSVFLVVTLFITEVVFAYSRVGGFSGSFQGYDYTQPRQVIHTVEKNESLWQIAKQFDVDFTKLAEVNGLDNPDLIFPGNKLVIKIQVDGSKHDAGLMQKGIVCLILKILNSIEQSVPCGHLLDT